METKKNEVDERCTCPAKFPLTCCCKSMVTGVIVSPYCPLHNEHPKLSPDCPLHSGLACYPKDIN